MPACPRTNRTSACNSTPCRRKGAGSVFQDTASGARSNRKGLADALQACAPGDVLTVWKLDRLGRTLLDLVGLVEKLKARDVGLKVLTGAGASIDTTKPEGRLFFAMFAAFAEFERELIRERTKAGMQCGEAPGPACRASAQACAGTTRHGGATPRRGPVAKGSRQGARRGRLDAAGSPAIAATAKGGLMGRGRRTSPPRPPAGPPADAEEGAQRVRALLVKTFDRQDGTGADWRLDAGKPLPGRVQDRG